MSGKPLRGFKSHSLRQFEGFNSPLIYIELFTLCVDVTKHFKEKLNLTLEVLVRTYELPSGDSKYEVERHRTCRESEALTDECLSVPYILNQKMERRANPF